MDTLIWEGVLISRSIKKAQLAPFLECMPGTMQRAGFLLLVAGTCTHGLTLPLRFPRAPGRSQEFLRKLDEKNPNQVVGAPLTVGGSRHPYDKCEINIFITGNSVVYWM